MNRLVESLMLEGLVTPEQVDEAATKQIGAKRPLSELLVEMGFISEKELTTVSSRLLGMPIESLDQIDLDENTIKKIPYDSAVKYGVFPVRMERGHLVLAMTDPTDVIAIDNIRSIFGADVKPVLSSRSGIIANIEKYYHSDDMLYDLLKNVVTDEKIELLDKENTMRERFDVALLEENFGPIIKMMNFVLGDSVRNRASDIHIEPLENKVRIRYRIDGDLKDIIELSKKFHSPLVARIKIMSNMDIAETRKAQEGRISIMAYGRKIDLRVALLPTYHGEKLVLRLLDSAQAKIHLDMIGFSRDERGIFKQGCNNEQGMILVTGPTGSGKTSTLYAAMNYTKDETKNIITIEDPIEYLIEGISQTQINPVKNITFPNALKNILRQDPNIILVGEIRDLETAEIAFKASLTGHLVFSTLHTNSAVETVTRLFDIGLEPYLVSSSIILIVAQRLVKRICPHCRVKYNPDPGLIAKFSRYIKLLNIEYFVKGSGCEKCGYSGYLDRTAIFEILRVTPGIRKLIVEKADTSEILKLARKEGVKLLIESGMEKVARRQTTIEEISRVMNFIYDFERPEAEKTDVKKIPTILVVDDEKNIRLIISARLKSAGYKIITADNGREALDLANKEKPDLIVMDVMMPQMNGYEATKILKSQLGTAFIPIMMLTAKRDVESELQGLDAGADDYMGKPFDGAKLLARVKLLLRKSSSEKEGA